MIDEDPQNESWPLALKRAELETKLQDRYAKAADALQRGEWAFAIDLLIEVQPFDRTTRILLVDWPRR